MVAILSFLRSHQPFRTKTNHNNPMNVFDRQLKDRKFTIEFFTPTPQGAYFSKQTFPVRKTNAVDELTQFTPPPHYHLIQDEHFKVEAGSGIWHLWNGRDVHLKQGDEIVIPARKWHWFENDPRSDVPLAVMYKYAKEYTVMEERFFRNLIGYMEDCRGAGILVSPIQLCVFCMHMWMPLAIWRGGSQRLNLLVNTIIMLIMGIWGEYVLGYESSYPEYYIEKSRIE